jgi:hypothetical protein
MVAGKAIAAVTAEQNARNSRRETPRSSNNRATENLPDGITSSCGLLMASSCDCYFAEKANVFFILTQINPIASWPRLF